MTAGEANDERTTRRHVALWAWITVGGVIAGYVAVLLANSRHFYTDDTEAQYVPLWVDIGRRLREGQFPGIVPEDWMSGNYLVEGQGSVFNPPQLLIAYVAPSIDNLMILATVVKLLYSIVLALGVYRVCLTYGARPYWAAVAGVAFCFSGWLLFLDQASWVLGLAGTAWLAHAWASAVRYARGLSGPVPLYIFLVLAITLGYVWPSVECVVMLVAVMAGEWINQRSYVPALKVMLASACAGLTALMTYLPSFLSSDVTWREADDRIKNDGFMTIPWSESLNASLPSTRPSFNSWFGLIQPFPVVYIAWFLVPALAFIAWRRVAGGLRELSAILIFAGLILTWTAGPAAFGPLRWPVRMLPMLALSLLVLVCVLLSRYGTVRDVRARMLVAGGLIGYLLVRSVSSAPTDRIWQHIGAAVIVLALTGAAVALVKRWGPIAACVAIIVTVAPIAHYQVAESYPHPMSWNLPEHTSQAQDLFPDFNGTTLQLGNSLLFPGDAKNAEGVYSSLVVGFYAKILDLTYVNGYTPIGHRAFGERFCMKWDGSTCPEAYAKIFSPEPDTGKPYVDLMKVDRVALMRLVYPDERSKPAPPGWHWVDYPPNDKWIWVLERDGGPISTVGGRIADADGVDARSVSETDYTSRVKVSSESGGRVVFARLPWPGYRVTLGGNDVGYDDVDGIFLTVDVPAGTRDADLVVTWRPPGMYLGMGSALAGLLGIAALTVLYRRSRRNDEVARDPLSIV